METGRKPGALAVITQLPVPTPMMPQSPFLSVVASKVLPPGWSKTAVILAPATGLPSLSTTEPPMRATPRPAWARARPLEMRSIAAPAANFADNR